MQRLWADDEAAFAGDHVRFTPSWSWPKPVQQPWPPILLGGAAGPRLFSHIAEYGDGWMPIGGSGLTRAIPELRRAVEETGRDPSGLQVITFGSIPDPGKLQHFDDIGVAEVILQLPSAPRDPVLSALDGHAQALSEL